MSAGADATLLPSSPPRAVFRGLQQLHLLDVDSAHLLEDVGTWNGLGLEVPLAYATNFIGESVRGASSLFEETNRRVRSAASGSLRPLSYATTLIQDSVGGVSLQGPISLATLPVSYATMFLEETVIGPLRASLTDVEAEDDTPAYEETEGQEAVRAKVYCTLPTSVMAQIRESSTNLRTLELRASEHTSNIAKLSSNSCLCFSSNSTLTSIALYGWNVDDQGLHNIIQCNSVRRLSIIDNNITNAGLDYLMTNTSIRELDLGRGPWCLPGSFVGITAIGAKKFASIENLRVLELNGHSLGTDGAICLARALTDLTYLGLARNCIGNDGAIALAELSSLTALDLSFNCVDSATVCEHFSRATNLLSLNLSHNLVNDDSCAILLQNNSIGFLHLGTSLINGAGLARVQHATNLVSLDLSLNPLSTAGLVLLSASTSLTVCELRQAYMSPSQLDERQYWTLKNRLEDNISSNMQAMLQRRRKLLFLLVSLARQRTSPVPGLLCLPLDLIYVILGSISFSDFGKTASQLQSCARFVFQNIGEINQRLRDCRFLHIIEKSYYPGISESFRFAEDSEAPCCIS